MFGLNLPTLASIRPKVDPKDVPPPTPVVFPAPHTSGPAPAPAETATDHSGPASLVETLQRVCRPGDIRPEVFDSLGLRTYYDAHATEVIPDPSYSPDFASWRQLSTDEVMEQSQSTRKPLNNGNLSPGCQVYRDRVTELSISNEDAFRTVRRLPAQKGKKPVRLGNSYEFFRCLELLTCYWDDPCAAPKKPVKSPEAETDPENPAAAADPTPEADDPNAVYRTMEGATMPAEFRHGLVSAFIKLVAYDFGCNVSTPRSEPRLLLCAPPTAGRAARKSHVSSGCIFVFRTPTKREHARAGFVEGPVAAVSARGTTALDVPLEKDQDLAREVLAALVTAQHRAREGRTEKRFGEGAWWATKARWGGGTGGPIGREIEGEEAAAAAAAAAAAMADGDQDASSPPAKKPRKTMPAYDNYRMIRPPSLTWDRKTRYEAIGRLREAGYDDVFVVSSLFHHVSVVRVRVPIGLLDELEGAEGAAAAAAERGKLVLWRSKWFDFFVAAERIEAMELLWGVFAYQMRANGEVQGSG